MNMNKQTRLYKQEYRPFYKIVPTSAVDESAYNNWQRLPTPSSGKQIPDENMMQLRFKFKFDAHFLQNAPKAEGDESCGFKVYFAFCYPQSYMESQTKLMRLEARTEETENLRAHTFSHNNKKIVFISSRVHPGETPAQFVWDGILNLLLSDDCRAVQLRSQYVFKMVPMLNPDGVARGHYRTDSRGCNLNRFYDEPTHEAHPSIYAIKQYLTSQKLHLQLYLDLHAHASKRGCFIYGNHLASCEKQLANQLYVKCISMNSPWFEYKGCDFSRKGMSGKDKRDNGLTKEGSGRVGIFNATDCSHCYTLECNYNEGLGTNQIGNCTGVNFPEGSSMGTVFGESPIDGYEGIRVKFDRYVGNPSRMTTPKYNREMFCNVGEGCAVALLDMAGSNPLSRLGGTVPTTNPSRGISLASSNWIGVVNEIKSEITRKRGEWEKVFGEEDAVKENQFAQRWLDSGDCPMWKWGGGGFSSGDSPRGRNRWGEGEPEQAKVESVELSPTKFSQYVLEKDRVLLPPASGSSPKVGPGLGNKQIFRAPQKGARSTFKPKSSAALTLPPGPGSRYRGLVGGGGGGGRGSDSAPRQGFGGENLW
ncbi:hypothetical protein TL16_g08069 [Triparma laevis f. inornata]|uniref:tubulin-glutamate carboxypeptidase n=1 Tax=Triparma laevis f. inornata TaxID=1714386 RepID=A0A9W7AWN2_9STRA|nr:hypothetical protein TL16_g08069 [Triparma laevis f. inornata]